MAIMYPNNISEYAPTDSEQLVFYELKQQLPDTYEVFYSVSWTYSKNGKKEKSEADFVVLCPDYGFLCLEVKGGSGIKIENNEWILIDDVNGNRKLYRTPYEQAEASMYYFKKAYSNEYNIDYQGISGAGVIFPFYAVDDIEKISNRPQVCTIDSKGINNLYDKIKKMFKFWGGQRYGFNVYSSNQHKSFVELIRKRIAINAAAGALVKYKERQLDVINRVQDNYIYLLSNINQFYIRGGAGTGKTWIAMKIAQKEASLNKRVMFICVSKPLAFKIRDILDDRIDVFYLDALKNNSTEDNLHKYDAILVDEAQDFNEDMALYIKTMLVDENTSRLGVFYDDVQNVTDFNFENTFRILTPEFLLRENIRNTANIYKFAMESTDLGKDVVTNPVEGPWPVTQFIDDFKQLLLQLELIFKKFIDDEGLLSSSIVVLVEDSIGFIDKFKGKIAKWKLVTEYTDSLNEIKVSAVIDFKGLESDMVIYVHDNNVSKKINYIAYTRAKYYLIEYVYNDGI